jgi:hypothetical protein
VVLGPGLYGTITVGVNATLVLRGLSPGSGVGRYGVAAVKIGTHASLFADNPVVLNVQGRFSVGGNSAVAPSRPVTSRSTSQVPRPRWVRRRP